MGRRLEIAVGMKVIDNHPIREGHVGRLTSVRGEIIKNEHHD